MKDSANRRLRIRAESGHMQTVPSESASYVRMRAGNGVRLCLLGLGAGVQATIQAAAGLLGIEPDMLRAPSGPGCGPLREIMWLDAPEYLQQCPMPDIPAQWRRVEQVEDIGDATVVFFQPALRFFPSFWGPVLGALHARDIAAKKQPQAAATPEIQGENSVRTPKGVRAEKGVRTGKGVRHGVLLPGATGSLLTRELAEAFAAHACRVVHCEPEQLIGQAHEALDETPDAAPGLCFCVNGRGLDSSGEIFHTLRALGVDVHIWFVDTPWHVLSAFRAPWWKQARLWVTDDSFVAPLRAMGAERTHHLPLGASLSLFSHPAPYVPPPHSAPLGDIVFAGRSAFPDKAAFFAGQRVPPPLLQQAKALLSQNGTAATGTIERKTHAETGETPREWPDFAWWHRQLAAKHPIAAWPGFAIRAAGLGAEESNRLWRAHCIHFCHNYTQSPEWTAHARSTGANGTARGLTVFGDEGWRDLLPEMDIRPPVDYYGMLPSIYASARYSLNITSLLLPHGLTQRNFDVWTAGGFCLSSYTPGLNIFPPELVEPVAFRSLADIPHILKRLESEPALRAELIAGWQSEIAQRHSYLQRVQRVLEV